MLSDPERMKELYQHIQMLKEENEKAWIKEVPQYDLKIQHFRVGDHAWICVDGRPVKVEIIKAVWCGQYKYDYDFIPVEKTWGQVMDWVREKLGLQMNWRRYLKPTNGWIGVGRGHQLQGTEEMALTNHQFQDMDRTLARMLVFMDHRTQSMESSATYEL